MLEQVLILVRVVHELDGLKLKIFLDMILVVILAIEVVKVV
jgi:hypothetical protein